MKQYFWAAIALFSSSFCVAQSKNLKEFKDFEGRFKTTIPCETMNHSTQTVKTVLGDLIFHSFVCTPSNLDADNKVYLISYVDYPKGTFPIDSVDLKESFYQTTIATAVENINGQLIYQDNIKRQEIDGKFWRTDYNKGNAVMKTRIFLVGNRFYTVQVATQKARSRNLEAEKFLEAFKWF